MLCWFVAFTIRFKKPGRRISEEDRLSESSNTDDSLNAETGSLSSVDEKNVMQYETLYVTAEIVRSVLYSTKENVLCLHEVFRQVSLFLIFWWRMMQV